MQSGWLSALGRVRGVVRAPRSRISATLPVERARGCRRKSAVEFGARATALTPQTVAPGCALGLLWPLQHDFPAAVLRAPPPLKKFPAPQRRHLVSPAQRKKFLSSAQEAHFACENAGWRRTLEALIDTSLKVARLEDDAGTSLDHLLRVRLW